MRILDLENFRNLPAGTIYSRGKRDTDFDGIFIKGDILEHDFVMLSFCSPESFDSGDFMHRLSAMQDEGASYPMNTNFGRDGLFEDEAMFLILEKDDLMKLREFVDAAIDVANT